MPTVLPGRIVDALTLRNSAPICPPTSTTGKRVNSCAQSDSLADAACWYWEDISGQILSCQDCDARGLCRSRIR